MPLTAVGLGNWTRSYTGGIDGVGAACSVVTAANYPGNIGTIGHSTGGGWRVDRQNPPAGMVNLQIQRNGAPNPSTIGCVIVPIALSGQVGNPHMPAGPQQVRAHARFSELTRAIHNGLSQSVGSRRLNAAHRGEMQIQVFEVQGEFST